MNCFILGWVTQAMVSIITVLLGPVIAQGRVLQLSLGGHTFFSYTLGDPRHTSADDLHLHSGSLYRTLYVYRRALGSAGHRSVSVCF